jgi:hypothetical protein
VLPRAQNLQGHGKVEVVVQTDVYRVNILPLQKLPVICVEVLNLVCFAPSLQLPSVKITGCHHLGVWNVLIPFHMLLGDHTRSDQGHTNFFHKLSLSFVGY